MPVHVLIIYQKREGERGGEEREGEDLGEGERMGDGERGRDWKIDWGGVREKYK